MGKETYTKAELCSLTGLSKGKIEDLISNGVLVLDRDRVSSANVDLLLSQKEEYISLFEYSTSRSTAAFDGSKSAHRDKLVDCLELNDYFGIETLPWDELLIGSRRDGFFFRRSDTGNLDKHLEEFFSDYAKTEEEKIRMIIESTEGHTATKALLQRYVLERVDKVTSSVTDFVRRILWAPDVSELTNDGIVLLIKREMTETTKALIVGFLSFAADIRSVKYNRIQMTAKERTGLQAYPNETYLQLMTCVFNTEHIAKHEMIEKAITNHWYAEMWLYIALHLTCGWRAADICTNWKYVRLDEHPEYCRQLSIDLETLEDNILQNQIPDEVYEEVCKYSIGSIEIGIDYPAKTAESSPNPLLNVIHPGLYTFFGTLNLIAEVHKHQSGEGYMQKSRYSMYANKMRLREFFGQEMWDALKGQNLSSRRLNKDYLQGVEKSARQNGLSGIQAAMVASFARNHASLDTIRRYLRDEQWSGETAEFVLFCALERGVFAFQAYQAILTAYPDAMRALSPSHQTRLMKEVSQTPLQMQISSRVMEESMRIERDFVDGSEESVIIALKSMFEISQMRGKAKDDGTYCLRRAQRQICLHPEAESCIEVACPEVVFSKYGLRTLLRILSEYERRGQAGDKKAEAILHQILIPRFQTIINRLMQEMDLNKEERAAIKLLLQEGINGERA